MVAALGRITAKTLVIAFTGDRMFPPDDNRLDAERIPNARFHELQTRSAHLTTFALFPEDRQASTARSGKRSRCSCFVCHVLELAGGARNA
jgi:homoserine acetyltransferase